MTVLIDSVTTDIKPYTYELLLNGSYQTGNSGTVCLVYEKEYKEGEKSEWADYKGLRWRKPTPYRHERIYIAALRPSQNFVTVYQRKSGRDRYWTQSFAPGAGIFRSSIPGIFFPGGVPNFIDGESENLKSRVLTDVLNSVSLSDAGWGETVVLWKQTASLFSGNAAKIASELRKFWRDNKGAYQWWRSTRGLSPKQALQAEKLKAARESRGRNRQKARKSCNGCGLASKYLELVYGWIPLVSDIYASLALLEKQFKASGLAFNEKKSRSLETSIVRSYGPIHTPMSPGASFRCDNLSIATEHRCEVSLWYAMKDINVATLSGLGLINPAEVAWNVVPFSFVIDWMVQVGPWLRSFTAASGFEFISGTSSYKRTVSVGVPFTGLPSGGAISITDGFKFLNALVEAEYFRREVFDSQPVPRVTVKNPLSGTHIVNAIALLRSFIR